MLTALENGVKGGTWFSLIDKVYADLTLFGAARKVVANGGAAGVDHVTTEMFADHQQANLERLQRELRTEVPTAGHPAMLDSQAGQRGETAPRRDAPTGEACRRSSPTSNRTLRGWFGYFQHSHYTTFGRIDKWIRMRLAISCASDGNAAAEAVERITNAGQMPSLPNMDCMPCWQPMRSSVNPYQR